MNQKKELKNISAILKNKCPRCREGNIFISKNAYDLKNNLAMNEHCPVCGQPTEIELGFYYGTGYVSYALSVAFFVTTFVACSVLFGVSFKNNSIFWWLGISILILVLMQPLFMRLARSIWLSSFVKYNPNWKNEPLPKNNSIKNTTPEK